MAPGMNTQRRAVVLRTIQAPKFQSDLPVPAREQSPSGTVKSMPSPTEAAAFAGACARGREIFRGGGPSLLRDLRGWARFCQPKPVGAPATSLGVKATGLVFFVFDSGKDCPSQRPRSNCRHLPFNRLLSPSAAVGCHTIVRLRVTGAGWFLKTALWVQELRALTTETIEASKGRTYLVLDVCWPVPLVVGKCIQVPRPHLLKTVWGGGRRHEAFA